MFLSANITSAFYLSENIEERETAEKFSLEILKYLPNHCDRMKYQFLQHIHSFLLLLEYISFNHLFVSYYYY